MGLRLEPGCLYVTRAGERVFISRKTRDLGPKEAYTFWGVPEGRRDSRQYLENGKSAWTRCGPETPQLRNLEIVEKLA